MRKFVSAHIVRLKADIDRATQFLQIQKATGLDAANVLLRLYRLAGWFAVHGHYGKLKADLALVDFYLETPGFGAAMHGVGWLRESDGVLMLYGYCTISTARKTISRKLRDEILGGAVCVVCGSDTDLQIDHNIPIVRGGRCDRENLVPLCRTCNTRKGRMTLQEFTSQ